MKGIKLDPEYMKKFSVRLIRETFKVPNIGIIGERYIVEGVRRGKMLRSVSVEMVSIFTKARFLHAVI